MLVEAGQVVVQGGSITLKVPNFNEAREAVQHIAERCGGQTVSGQDRVSEKGKPHGWIRIVVPVAQLGAAMSQLRAIGQVYGDSLSQRDFSEDAEDLGSRTVRLKEHQNRLLSMLQSPRHLRGSDLLFVQDRIFRAGLDQDTLGHRRQQLAGEAAVSNISVFLFVPGAMPIAKPIAKTFPEKVAFAFGAAWKSFVKFASDSGMLMAIMLVYSLFWVPFALIVWLIGRRFGLPVLRTVAAAALKRPVFGVPGPKSGADGETLIDDYK
jgi:hypothetical protein